MKGDPMLGLLLVLLGVAVTAAIACLGWLILDLVAPDAIEREVAHVDDEYRALTEGTP